MSLIQCPECGGQVSTKANACPSCGAPPPGEGEEIDHTKKTAAKKPRKTMNTIAGIIVIVLLIATIGSGDDENEGSAAEASADETSASETKQDTSDPDEPSESQDSGAEDAGAAEEAKAIDEAIAAALDDAAKETADPGSSVGDLGNEDTQGAPSEASRTRPEVRPVTEEDVEATSDTQAEISASAEDGETACRRDLQCWGDKHSISAGFECEPYIEQLARYDYEWTDGWIEPKFQRFRWHDIDQGTVTYLGNTIKFQNGFGAWQRASYECDYDPINDVVLSVRAQ